MKKVTGGLPREDSYPYNPATAYGGLCSETNLIRGAQSRSYFQNLGDTSLINLLLEDPIVVSACSDEWSNYKSGTFRC